MMVIVTYVGWNWIKEENGHLIPTDLATRIIIYINECYLGKADGQSILSKAIYPGSVRKANFEFSKESTEI